MFCLCVCKCTVSVPGAYRDQKVCVRSPGIRVTDGDGLPSECHYLNPNPLQEQQMLLTDSSVGLKFSILKGRFFKIYDLLFPKI